MTGRVWRDYRETVYAADKPWIRRHIIEKAVERDPTVSPFDDWRIIERNGGLQAQVSRYAR